MQSLYGKLRLITNRAVNNLRNADAKSISFYDSRILGCSTNRASGLNSQHSSYGSASIFMYEKLGTKIGSAASLKSPGIVASALTSYGGLRSGLSQSASLASILPYRNITTSGPTSDDDVSASSSEVPQRIKFKRLDKTARHIMQIVDKEAVEEVKANREIPEIKPGYIVQLKMEVPENKRRVTTIKGIVIARRNAGLNTTIRIRRLVAGVGIENLLLLYSPNIKEIKVLDKKKVRRAKLYYLRDKMNALKKQ